MRGKEKEKVKCYKFSREGLQKAVIDRKSEKIGKWVGIGMWAVIGMLFLNGILSQDAMVKMLLGSGTSKMVKFMVR
jgi:uncharacterized 2Fe-2S/4Fe-4S cluster protein (DUF4445 family)